MTSYFTLLYDWMGVGDIKYFSGLFYFFEISRDLFSDADSGSTAECPFETDEDFDSFFQANEHVVVFKRAF